ncbi:MAG: CBS domain-containing protein [Dehalogenimonas sp.]|uniref:CBS domain-containing protein n=1 Tax=Candidatus Dehalogenimonas loeffleri TaxID=3127115 RepID=A0ABZ2J6S4_9CHLR|nr:CBS domain-containing protein [Dehalogenimonas sp.]
MDKTQVKTVSEPSSRTLSVNEDQPIEKAIRQFVKQPDVHTLFIVDDKGKLKGLVKLHYILNWVKLKLNMDVANRSNMRVAGAFQAFEIMKLCQSQTIGDIISETPSVKETDTLDQALHIMVHEQLVELPVVDGAGKLIGEVKLTHLLARMLEDSPDSEPICKI